MVPLAGTEIKTSIHLKGETQNSEYTLQSTYKIKWCVIFGSVHIYPQLIQSSINFPEEPLQTTM